MDASYELRVELPTVEEYLGLRVEAGLSAKSAEGAALGLAQTWFGVVVRRDGRAVGMGRVVGDGGTALLVVDVAVDPAHQRRGLGKAIVGRLVEEVRARAPEGTVVGLFADGEAHRLYAQFGFARTAPESVGMTLSVTRAGVCGGCCI